MMMGVADSNLFEMPYFEPPNKRVALNFKVPEALKANLQALVRLWKIRAEVYNFDPSDIDLTHVCTRLLSVGIDGAWAEAGKMAGLKGMPANEEEWARLSEALKQHANRK